MKSTLSTVTFKSHWEIANSTLKLALIENQHRMNWACMFEGTKELYCLLMDNLEAYVIREILYLIPNKIPCTLDRQIVHWKNSQDKYISSKLPVTVPFQAEWDQFRMSLRLSLPVFHCSTLHPNPYHTSTTKYKSSGKLHWTTDTQLHRTWSNKISMIFQFCRPQTVTSRTEFAHPMSLMCSQPCL